MQAELAVQQSILVRIVVPGKPSQPGARPDLPLSPLQPVARPRKSRQAPTFPFIACSLKTHLEDPRQQAMYGIIHGGMSLELRQQSIRYMTGLPFDGFAMGGALGKNRRAESGHCPAARAQRGSSRTLTGP